MINTPKVASAGTNEVPQSVLTEAQISEFWAGIVASTGAAKRMARKIVPKEDVEDVVHSGAILFIESLQKADKPARFPKDVDELRARFLKIVQNHALDCVRQPHKEEGSGLKYWAVEMEPLVGGRNTPDRRLEEVFARNDKDVYDAPADEPMRPQDNVDKLRRILRPAVQGLPPQQRKVIVDTFFYGRKRAEVAARLGMSVNTYDNHLRAAYENLCDPLWNDALEHGEPDRSVWYDRIEILADRKMTHICYVITEGIKLLEKIFDRDDKKAREADASSAVDAA